MDTEKLKARNTVALIERNTYFMVSRVKNECDSSLLVGILK